MSDSDSTDSENDPLLALLLANMDSVDENRNEMLLLLLLLLRRRRRQRVGYDYEGEYTSSDEETEVNEPLVSSIPSHNSKDKKCCPRSGLQRNVVQGTNKNLCLANPRAKLSKVSNSSPTPQHSHLKPKPAAVKETLKPMLQQGGVQQSQNSLAQIQKFQTAKRVSRVSQLTIQNVAAHNAKFPSLPLVNHPNIRKLSNMPQSIMLPSSPAESSAKHRLERMQQEKPSGEPGTSKRRAPTSENGERKQKWRKRKIIKTSHDNQTESVAQEHDPQQQNPFEMIEIVENRIKEEILEPVETNEMPYEENLSDDGVIQDSNFETVYCTPDPIKMEFEDDNDATDMEPVAPECLASGSIKQEPRDFEVEESQEVVQLMWRCPVVTCPQMFSTEVEMYQHLNLNHTVKGPALPSKSRKSSSSTTPLISTGLVLLASPVLPSSSGSVVVTTTSAPLFSTSTASLTFSSSGPVVVTTTFTTTSTPLLTTSVSSTSIISTPSTTTAPLPSVSPKEVPLEASSADVSTFCVGEASSSGLVTGSPVSLPVKNTTQNLHKLIVAPTSGQGTSVTSLKTLLVLTPQKQIPSNNPIKQIPVQIFNSTKLTIEEDLPPCATNDSEMFSISLAKFPQDRRLPIKRKLLNVVDCVKQKNISADNILIAYYENSSDSRTM